MHWIAEEVPWGNLFRTAVTALAFFYLFWFVAVFVLFTVTGSDAPEIQTAIGIVAAILAFVLASIVVWSERIGWIGDPDSAA